MPPSCRPGMMSAVHGVSTMPIGTFSNNGVVHPPSWKTDTAATHIAAAVSVHVHAVHSRGSSVPVKNTE